MEQSERVKGLEMVGRVTPCAPKILEQKPTKETKLSSSHLC